MAVDVETKYKEDILFHFPLRTFTETAVNDLQLLEWKDPAQTVTSVADNGSGFARFTYSGGQVIRVGMPIENTTFADSNYNITDEVSVTDGSSFYELSTDPVFTATGTGLFVSTEASLTRTTLDAAYKALRGDAIGDVVDELMLPKATNNTIIEINATAELEDLATSSVITVSTDTTFIFNVDITTDTRFVFTGQPQVSFITLSGSTYTYTETGTQTLFSGDGTIIFDSIAWLNFTGTCTLIESGGGRLSGRTLFVDALIAGWSSLGTITDGLLIVRFCTFALSTGGFTTDNTIVVLDTSGGDLSTMTGPLLTFSGAELPQLIVQAQGMLGVLGSEALLRIDPAINAAARVAVLGGTMQGTTLFDISSTKTANINTIADAAVAATTINSVSDAGSGEARFNFTAGPTMFVGQTVIISTFTTNTAYNGTFVIGAVAAGSFDVASVPFGTTETGSFLSNSVLMTSASQTFVDGDTITFTGQDTIDYDAGYTVYNSNVSTTFEVSAVFVATETGSVTNAGLDQDDSRVVSRAVTNFEDSHYIAAAYVNNNTTATTIATNGVYVDIDFGALTGGSTMERFKMIDSIIGEFIYFGNEDFDGFITFDFSLTSSGGTVDFLFKWQNDVGAGYVDLTDAVLALANVGAGGKNVTKTFPLRLTKGDTIKPQVTRVSGASSITAEYATIYISQ